MKPILAYAKSSPTHRLSVVIYHSQFCEIGPNKALFAPSYHPYTEALLWTVLIPDPSVERANIRLSGTVLSALNPPPGCHFHTR